MLPMVLPLLLPLLVAAQAAAGTGRATGGRLSPARYAGVFAFGNSLTDTGNAAIFPATATGPSTRQPYGQTYFGHPTGRASDGRLIIDFLGTQIPVPSLFMCLCAACKALKPIRDARSQRTEGATADTVPRR